MPTMEAVKIDAKKLQEARLAKFLSRDEPGWDSLSGPLPGPLSDPLSGPASAR